METKNDFEKDTDDKSVPNNPQKRIPTKPDKNPDPTKPIPGREPEKIDPTRIDEPSKTDSTYIDEPSKPSKK
ncbi:MAG: hypothetical protein HYU69_02065 [Bacteroidetes bacterium]|nr:hypothetical protein [Bacteroidota bacterium]